MYTRTPTEKKRGGMTSFRVAPSRVRVAVFEGGRSGPGVAHGRKKRLIDSTIEFGEQ